MPARKPATKKKKKPAPETFRFSAPLERLGNFYGVVFPYAVEEIFGSRKAVRMNALISGIAIDRALIPSADGSHHLLIPGDLRRRAKLRVGDMVHVELTQNMRPDEIPVPEELQAALDLEPGAAELYENLNPGMKRNVVYWVNSAKRTETRVERALMALRRIMSGELHGKRSQASATGK